MGTELALTDTSVQVIVKANAMGIPPVQMLERIQSSLTTVTAQQVYCLLFADSRVGPEAFAEATRAILRRENGIADSDATDPRDEPDYGGDGIFYNKLNALALELGKVLSIFELIMECDSEGDALELAMKFVARFGTDSPDFAEALRDCLDDLRIADIVGTDDPFDAQIIHFAVTAIVEDKAKDHELHDLLTDPRDYFRWRGIGKWEEEQ